MTNNTHEPNTAAKRYPTQEIVHVEISGRQNNKLLCKLENLSTTGSSLKILSAKVIPRPNDIIKITVDLKSINKTHTLYAKIIWINGLSLGACFTKQ
jgi:hypothetical protein